MSGQNFIVPPLSWKNIERNALDWREMLGLSDIPYLPLIDVVEKILVNKLEWFDLVILPKSEMGEAEGWTDPNGEFICLREDVYTGACEGNTRDRFTVAHELGHWELHTNVPLARETAGQNVPHYRRSEPQANQFAVQLLMPSKFFSLSDTVEDVMERHGVGYDTARHRLQYLKGRGEITK